MADMDLLKLMLSQCTAILFAHEHAALWTGDRKGQVKRSIFAAKSEYAVYFPSGITNGDVKRLSLVSYNHNLTSSGATLTRQQASITRSYMIFVL
jgi:hypothetical protein